MPDRARRNERSWLSPEVPRQALAMLAGHPLRSGLAGLAMAAAVATTATVVTGLDGFARSARQATAATFGADTFVLSKIASGGLTRRELADKLARNRNIRRADVRFLQRYAADLVLYAPLAQRRADVASGTRRFEDAAVYGAGAALFDIRDIRVAGGRFFTTDEEAGAAQVVVLGRNIADALFPGLDPLGAPVRIGGRAFRVIGVVAPQGTMGGVSLDRFAWIPITAFDRVFGLPSTLEVLGRAADVSRTPAAEDRARASLRARRALAPGVPDDFDLVTPEASRTFVAQLSERIGAAGPPISLMALLAAVVVIANTTLVSVTQRTREIGIRRALGAPRAHVVAEVLTEAAMVALAGGVVGLGAAAAVLWAASGALGIDLPLTVPTSLATLVAAGTAGLTAGWYPARRAATVPIITALRSE
jgi:putative ABC transport system permease protein